MRKILLFGLVLGVIYAGVTLGRRRNTLPDHSPDVDQWEGEGGAVPIDGDRTAAQTRPA